MDQLSLAEVGPVKSKTLPCRGALRWLLPIALVLAVARPAAAANITPEQAERVTELTKEAQVLRSEGRYAEAIEKLDAAIAIYPAPVLFYNLGRTREDAGDFAGAVDAYDRCLAAEPSRDIRKKAQKARADVRRRLADAARPDEPTPDEPTPDEPTPDEPAPAEPAPGEPRHSLFRLGLTVSEGALMFEGTAYRGKVGLELMPSLDFGWFGVDLGAAVVVEPPVAFLLRPGVRFRLSVFYFRPALNFLLTPITTSGALFAVGAEIPIGASFRFVAEFDASLWFQAVGVVPLDGRLGVSYGF